LGIDRPQRAWRRARDGPGGFINGDFATGDLTDWTAFTTANGTNGVDPVSGAPLPDVVLFNTTGTGATNSAHFNVGHLSGGDPEGGGISQSLTVSAGTYTLTGAFASLDKSELHAQR
jgi:hypothetical protein